LGRSAFISAALHAAILLWIIVILPGARPLDAPPIKEIPVDIVSPSALTSIKAGTEDAKSDKALAAKPQPKSAAAAKPKTPDTQVAAAPPPPPPPPAVSPKAPAPDKAESPKPAEAEAPPKLDKAAEAPKPKDDQSADSEPPPSLPLHRPPPPKMTPTRPKPSMTAKSKDDLNTDRIAALLNKVPDSGGGPSSDEASQDAAARAHGQSNGTKLAMSVDEIDALRARIAQCWNPPPGGLGAAHIVIKLRMKLNEDGTLVGYPTVENSDPSPYFQAAADSAVRAVYQCQPYVLPPEKYSLWRDMILNFDPSDMYRAG
jgi:hypothetical protein